MDLDDLTPALGGSLRDPAGTFIPTGAQHPDAIWNPRGGELSGGSPQRSGSGASFPVAEVAHAASAPHGRPGRPAQYHAPRHPDGAPVRLLVGLPSSAVGLRGSASRYLSPAWATRAYGSPRAETPDAV
jgi:hypothetical protein